MTVNRGVVRNRRIAWAAFCLWAVLYAGSVFYLVHTEPTGDGFTRGMNRLTGFLGFQVLAAIPAVVLAVAAGRMGARRSLRWLARVPVLQAILLVGAIVFLLAWAKWGPEPMAGPPVVPGKPTEAPGVAGEADQNPAQ